MSGGSLHLRTRLSCDRAIKEKNSRSIANPPERRSCCWSAGGSNDAPSAHAAIFFLFRNRNRTERIHEERTGRCGGPRRPHHLPGCGSASEDRRCSKHAKIKISHKDTLNPFYVRRTIFAIVYVTPI